VNPDLGTYVIAGSLDIPDLTPLMVETYEPSGPYGLNGVGEVGINGPLPATAGALDNACGIPDDPIAPHGGTSLECVET
jgi:CO/xanthine dehydrogenase Mo-binding subunit